MPPPLDWTELVHRAEIEGLAPALGLLAQAGELGIAPADVRAHLAHASRATLARHVIMSCALGAVVRAFDEAGIPVIVLKGVMLAEIHYRHPAMRPYHDLDLLVGFDDRLHADHRLCALGYRRLADAHGWAFDVAYDGATVYERPDGVRVDLHWRLATEPRFRWNDAATAEVWPRARVVELAGAPVRVLAPEDLLLALAIHHGAHHAFAGLLWTWDLAVVIDRDGDRLDWEALVARARRWRVRTVTYFALRHVASVFGAGVPREVLVALVPRTWRSVALRAALARFEGVARARLEHLVPLLLVDRGRDVLSSLGAVAWPSADWLRARYGSAAPPGGTRALYAAHCRRMVDVAARTLTALVPSRDR